MKKRLAILLVVCTLLNAQGFSSWAQEEIPVDALANTVSGNDMKKNDETVSENDKSKEAVSGEDTIGESVSGNDVPNETISENRLQKGTVSENNTPNETVSENSVSENSVSQNSISESSISENSLFRVRRAPRAGSLSDATLKRHTVKGMNPEQTVVTLFDYWKDDDPGKSRDERRLSQQEYLTEGYNYAHGISKDHMLIFGKFDGFGPWNTSWKDVTTDTSAVGMVKNELVDGCPVLNLSADKWNVTNYGDTNLSKVGEFQGTYFGKFDSNVKAGDGVNYKFPENFLKPDGTGKVKAKEESLAYLFSSDYHR